MRPAHLELTRSFAAGPIMGITKAAMKITEKQPKKIVRLDELMAAMDMDQRHLLEELYELWTWHPGMG